MLDMSYLEERIKYPFRGHRLAEEPLTRISRDSEGNLAWNSMGTPYSEPALKDWSPCIRQKGKKHGWKPHTMKLPVLTLMSLCAFVLALLLELAAQTSDKYGGVAFSENSDDFAPIYEFLYNFFPTILTVTYSLGWTWIDLDIKRLEPWIAMSTPEGALAENSLFIKYPLQFMPWSFYRAFQRQQRRVVYSSLIMLLITTVITPLVSMTISNKLIVVTRETTVNTTKAFIPTSDQPNKLDQSVLYRLFEYTWLNSSLPAYTADDYGLAPFKIDIDRVRNGIDTGNITSTTTRYWSDLTCTPALYNPSPNTTMDPWYATGTGCNITGINFYSKTNSVLENMWYIGWQDSAFESYSLSSYGYYNCPKALGEHLFMIAAGTVPPSKDNVTGEANGNVQFCETSYYSQPVEVTVSYPEYAPLAYTPLGSPQPLDTNIFNVTAFEFLEASGRWTDNVPRDFYMSQYIEQYPQVQALGLGLSPPLDTMVGFALGRNRSRKAKDYVKTDIVVPAFTAGHRSLFAVAVSYLMTDAQADVSSRKAIYTFAVEAITVHRVLSIVAESLLCLVGILTGLLAWECHKSVCNLSTSPNSIKSMMTSFHNKGQLEEFSNCGDFSEESLFQTFKGKRFRFRCGCETSSGDPVLERVPEGDTSPESIQAKKEQIRHETFGVQRSGADLKGWFDPVRPFGLRRRTGFLFFTCLVAAASVLIWLWELEKSHNGIPLLSKKIVNLILFSYIPTGFGTILEPCLSFVNHNMAVLQPYKDLCRGHQPAQRTIDARYTSVPPPLLFFRALRSRHIILAIICAITLLANVLSVALSGLYSSTIVTMTYPINATQTITTRLNNTVCTSFNSVFENIYYYDPGYVQLMNYTEGTVLVPWATRDFYFQPFAIPENIGTSFSAVVDGFTADAGCSDTFAGKNIGLNPPNMTFSLPADPRSNNTACDFTASAPLMILLSTPATTPSGRSKVEGIGKFEHPSEDCETGFAAYWIQYENYRINNSEVAISAAACRPYMSTGKFNITVDPLGHIIRYHNISDIAPLDDSEQVTAAHHFIYSILTNIDTTYVHQTNTTMNAMMHLVKALSGNNTWFEPNQTIANINDTLPTIEQAFKTQMVIALALNERLFVQGDERTIPGYRQVLTERMFASKAAFWVCVIILFIDAAVIAFIYYQGINFYLPRLPSTIGSLLAYVAMNRGLESQDPDLLKDKTFSFGRYQGIDNKTQVGIEEDNYIIKIKSVEARRWVKRSWMTAWIHKIRRKREDPPML